MPCNPNFSQGMEHSKPLRSAPRPFLLAATAAFSVSAFMTGGAQAQIYRCEGPDGVVEYSNAPGAVQAGKRCTEVRLNPITTVPAPRLPATKPAAPAPSPAAGRRASPDDFPKVDPATQRTRDDGRRRILEDELAKEEQRLTELRSEYKGGEPDRLGSERNYQKYLDRVQRLQDDIGRTEANIAALRRELGALRD